MFDYGYGGGSTLNQADVYGIPTSGLQMPAPISAGGPNQSFVSGVGSSLGTITGSPAPAISILGLVLILVAWRLAVELGSE